MSHQPYRVSHCCGLIGAALFAATGIGGHGSAPLAEVPFELNNNLVFIKVSVNGGSPEWFDLDTGFEYSLLNTTRARRRGLAIHGERDESAPGGAVSVGTVDNVNVTLPRGLVLVRGTLHALPLDGIEAVLGHPMGGILGHDFFTHYVVTIDYAHRRVRLHDPASFVYRGDGTAIPITVRDSQIFVTASLHQAGSQSVTAVLKVDVGSADALGLNGSFVQATHLVSPTQRRLPATGAAVGGKTENYVTRLDTLQLGPFLARDLVMGYSADTARAGDAGTLGGELLRRFTVTFDYQRARCILEPNVSYPEAFEYDMSGLFLTATGAGFQHVVVGAVTPGSPAATAGLRSGDELVSINGQPAHAYGLAAVRHRFSHPGHATLVLERAGRSISVVLVLHRLI